MRKTVSILTFLFFSVIAVMLPEGASAQRKMNTLVNRTTKNVIVVYTTWRSAIDDTPEGYLTRGHLSLKPGKSVKLKGWKNDVYFRIRQDGEAIKPAAATETFRFWVHPKPFKVVSPRMDGSVRRDQLAYTEPTGITLTPEDGFIRYPNGSVVTVDSSWVSVSEKDETEPVSVEPPVLEPTVSTANALRITEIMVDTGSNGMLPQWIEIANTSGAPVNLMGWSINIDNDPADATVDPSLHIALGNVDVGRNQTALVVSKMSNRNSGVGTFAGMLRADRIIDANTTGDGAAILSQMAFRIRLVQTPRQSGAVARADVVGNLVPSWELPMSEGNARSSLLRRDMAGVMGTDATGWVLASSAEGHLAAVPFATYYGDKNDMGSPGYSKAGGALPVELSKFGAKRDPLTGQVMITWETQSELNNAGFFIKRSQQPHGEFKVINATMIPGAGTTSEKQTYTYTDMTAQPNVAYYYQIEDVSLDGQRQTLTRAIRLKGHIGAAGKLTSTWGKLKVSNE